MEEPLNLNVYERDVEIPPPPPSTPASSPSSSATISVRPKHIKLPPRTRPTYVFSTKKHSRINCIKKKQKSECYVYDKKSNLTIIKYCV